MQVSSRQAAAVSLPDVSASAYPGGPSFPANSGASPSVAGRSLGSVRCKTLGSVPCKKMQNRRICTMQDPGICPMQDPGICQNGAGSDGSEAPLVQGSEAVSPSVLAGLTSAAVVWVPHADSAA